MVDYEQSRTVLMKNGMAINSYRNVTDVQIDQYIYMYFVEHGRL
jgi:hypothetical protein